LVVTVYLAKEILASVPKKPANIIAALSAWCHELPPYPLDHEETALLEQWRSRDPKFVKIDAADSVPGFDVYQGTITKNSYPNGYLPAKVWTECANRAISEVTEQVIKLDPCHHAFFTVGKGVHKQVF